MQNYVLNLKGSHGAKLLKGAPNYSQIQTKSRFFLENNPIYEYCCKIAAFPLIHKVLQVIGLFLLSALFGRKLTLFALLI